MEENTGQGKKKTTTNKHTYKPKTTTVNSIN